MLVPTPAIFEFHPPDELQPALTLGHTFDEVNPTGYEPALHSCLSHQATYRRQRGQTSHDRITLEACQDDRRHCPPACGTKLTPSDPRVLLTPRAGLGRRAPTQYAIS